MVQEVATKAIPKEKKRKKAKSGKVLQITEEGREVKGKKGRERYNELSAEFQRTARKDRKAL